MTWGIWIYRKASDKPQRGKQYWRPRKGAPWKFRRDTFPTRAAALHRLNELRAQGWHGNTFQVVEYPNATYYSKHFTRAELDCKCGCKTPASTQRNLAKLAAELEKLRAIVGPIHPISGYRCAAYNKKIGGASKSQHLTGNACDLGIPAGNQASYVLAATRVPDFNNGGIGVYPNGGVHVDRRGYRARWNSWVRS